GDDYPFPRRLALPLGERDELAGVRDPVAGKGTLARGAGGRLECLCACLTGRRCGEALLGRGKRAPVPVDRDLRVGGDRRRRRLTQCGWRGDGRGWGASAALRRRGGGGGGGGGR